MGNRLTQNDNGALTNYTYDIANRLTNVNGVTYTWDNNGNLLNDGTSAYTYDQANRLKTLTQGTNNYAFAYNSLSDRISQTIGITQTRYVLDPNAGLTQVLSDGTSTYLYGIGRIAQQQTNLQHFGADGLGNVRQLYNSSGQIIGSTKIDDLLEKRNAIGQQLMDLTAETAGQLGLGLLSVDVKDIMFTGELKKTFAQVVKAQKEGLAILEKARGETAALRNLVNAAKLIEDNPALMQLRLLQHLGETPGNTLVLGVPPTAAPLPMGEKRIELPKSPESDAGKSEEQ